MTHPEAPARIAHWGAKTARPRELIDWYGRVFGARVVHENKAMVFRLFRNWSAGKDVKTRQVGVVSLR